MHSLEKQIKGFRPGGDFCADSDCKTVALFNMPTKDDLSLKARKKRFITELKPQSHAVKACAI